MNHITLLHRISDRVCTGLISIKIFLTAAEFTGLTIHSILRNEDLSDDEYFEELNELESKNVHEILNEIQAWFGRIALENKALEEGFKTGEIQEEIKELVKSKKKKKEILNKLKEITEIQKIYLNNLLNLPPPTGEVLKDLVKSYLKNTEWDLKQERMEKIKRIMADD